MNSKLPTVNISGTSLSDLFFKSDSLVNFSVLNTTDAKASVLEDAKMFIADLGIANQVTPEQLVEDFFARY